MKTRNDYTKRIRIYEARYESNPSYKVLYEFMMEVQSCIYQINFSLEMVRDFQDLIKSNRLHFRNMLNLGEEQKRSPDDLRKMKAEFEYFIHNTQCKANRLKKTFQNRLEQSQTIWNDMRMKINTMKENADMRVRQSILNLRSDMLKSQKGDHAKNSTHISETMHMGEEEIEKIPEGGEQMEIIHKEEGEMEIVPEEEEDMQIIQVAVQEEMHQEDFNVLEILDDEGQVFQKGDLMGNVEWEEMLEMHEQMGVWEMPI